MLSFEVRRFCLAYRFVPPGDNVVSERRSYLLVVRACCSYIGPFLDMGGACPQQVTSSHRRASCYVCSFSGSRSSRCREFYFLLLLRQR